MQGLSAATISHIVLAEDTFLPSYKKHQKDNDQSLVQNSLH